MGIPDPVMNCILAVCCSPSSKEQLLALAKFYMGELGVDESAAVKFAEATLRHFDLAEQGTLQPFKDSIAKLARG